MAVSERTYAGTDTPTLDDFRDAFRDAVADHGGDADVDDMLWAEQILGAPVDEFPSRHGRQPDPLARAVALRLLRRTVGDLVTRPDLHVDGRAHFHSPENEGADTDLVYDAVIEPGDLDFDDRPAVVLGRFALHRNFGLGIDPDGIYVAQRVMVAVDLGDPDDPDVRVLASTLSVPVADDHGGDLPSADVRDDLEELRQRVWRDHTWRALASQAAAD